MKDNCGKSHGQYFQIGGNPQAKRWCCAFHKMNSDEILIRRKWAETAAQKGPQKKSYICRKVEFEGKVISNDCKCKEGELFHTPLEGDE